MDDRSLVGAVVERHPTSSAGTFPKFAASGKTGFPIVQHRSRGTSAFARGRDGQKRNPAAKSSRVPYVVPTKATRNGGVDHDAAPVHESVVDSDSLDQISAENRRRVDNMTDEEREQARAEIFEHFGPGVEDLMRKAMQSRQRMAESRQSPVERAPEALHFSGSSIEGELTRLGDNLRD